MRSDNRTAGQLRPIKITRNFTGMQKVLYSLSAARLRLSVQLPWRFCAALAQKVLAKVG